MSILPRTRLKRDFLATIEWAPLLRETDSSLLEISWSDSKYWSDSLAVAMELMDSPENLERLILSLPPHLFGKAPGAFRLGIYFECLLDFWLRNSSQFEVLAKGKVVRSPEGGTLGEIDWLLRNLAIGGVEHWECAVKFYLADVSAQTLFDFHGPNRKDTFGRKLAHMVQKQLALKVADFDVERSICLIKGRLFFRWCSGEPIWTSIGEYQSLHPESGVAAIRELDPQGSAGLWITFDQLPQLLEYLKRIRNIEGVGGDELQCFILPKTCWLSRVEIEDLPSLSLFSQTKDFSISHPCYVSLCLRADVKSQKPGILELERFFVVPNRWLGLSSYSPGDKILKT